MNSPASSDEPHEQAEELCQPQQCQPLRSETLFNTEYRAEFSASRILGVQPIAVTLFSVEYTPLGSNQQPSVP